MRLDIPSAHRSLLCSFLAEPPEERQKEILRFTEAISSIAPTLDVFAQSENLSAINVDSKDPRLPLFSAFMSMLFTQRKVKTKDSEFTQMILRELKGSDDTHEIDWDSALDDLNLLMEARPRIALLSEARKQYFENQNLYYNSTVTVDVRHVIDSDIPEPWALLLHRLRITFCNAGGNQEEMYFTLDSQDLRELQSVLTSSIKCEETLKTTLSGHVQLLDRKAGET